MPAILLLFLTSKTARSMSKWAQTTSLKELTMLSPYSRSCSMATVMCLALLFTSPAMAQRRQSPDGLPDELFAPVGTVLTVTVRDHLSSNKSGSGDQFIAALQQPLVIDGWVVARPGQTVFGTV